MAAFRIPLAWLVGWNRFPLAHLIGFRPELEADERITEAGEPRITESGESRITE